MDYHRQPRFPFNWFPLRERTTKNQRATYWKYIGVSIQLVSSAREDKPVQAKHPMGAMGVSIQLVSSAREDDYMSAVS